MEYVSGTTQDMISNSIQKKGGSIIIAGGEARGLECNPAYLRGGRQPRQK